MSERFFESQPWRFVVTNLDGETMTFLDKLCSNREINRTLNAPMRINGSVPSDSPEVNIVTGDGSPWLSEGDRLLYCFRREGLEPGSHEVSWVVRASGTILTVEDRGGPDAPVTDFEANDPWQVLYARPLRDEFGLPPADGFHFNAPGNEIAFQLLAMSELHDGPTRIDLLTGTVETTATVEIDFQQGMSVGEAFDALTATGTMDIVLEPIYDPIDKPGILCQINIYDHAGVDRHNAIFAWDKPSRSLVDLNRNRDGQQRANKLQYYIGQGGPPVPLVTDAASVAKYGRYWDQQFFPGQEKAMAVEAFAEKQRSLRSDGLVTYTMSPAPERSPIPFVDYDIGDRVPIYGSRRLREAVFELKRVVSIPLVIGDDQMEAPAQVVLEDETTGIDDD
jgi:hypothetical protein